MALSKRATLTHMIYYAGFEDLPLPLWLDWAQGETDEEFSHSACAVHC